MEGSTETVNLASNKKIKTGIAPRDNIGRLPEVIFHHILSYLDMKEVLQTSFLSRRWRYTWKFVQVMNFDYSLWEPEEKSSSEKMKKRIVRPYVKRVKEGCMDFVDRLVYDFRDLTTTIKILKLSKHYCRDRGQLERLLLYVLPNLKELHLESDNKRGICELPRAVFTSEKLEVFVVLHKITKCFNLVVLPDTMCSNFHLKTLILRCCQLPHGDSNGELVLKNPVLKKLSLINCDHHRLKVMNIIAPQLKELVIENFGTGDKYNCSESVQFCELKLCAPILLMLRLNGHAYREFSMGDLSFLVTADIGFKHRWPSQAPMNFSHCLRQFQNVSMLSHCLRQFRNVSMLQLERLPLNLPVHGSIDILYEPLSLFCNLRHLVLGWKLGLQTCMPILTKILQSSSSVETLEVGRINMWTHFEENYWRTELPMQDKFHHLKCFKIAGFKLRSYELKFLTFMVTNSTALEKIKITYKCEFEGTKEVIEFEHRLRSLLEASSKVTIDFTELNDD